MWPFKAAPPKPRVTPSVPFIDGQAWSSGGLTDAYVSPAAAEALAAVLCAVTLIADTIAGLPAEVLRTDEAGTPAKDHALQRLIDTGPNERETWSDLLSSFIASALLRGNGLIEARWSDRGVLTELATAPWGNVTAWTDDAGNLLFDYLPMHGPGAGERRRLLRDEVVYLKDRSDNGVVGVSRLQRAGTSLQLGLDTLKQTRQWLANSPRPAGVLQTAQRMDPADAKRLGEEWAASYSGGRVGKPAILHGGLEWKGFELFSAADAQVVERLKFSVEDVARIYQVPPSFLGDSTRATFASAQAASTYLARHTLLPWVVKIERAFAASVLGSGYRLNLDIGSLLKSDYAEYSTALSKYRAAGILSPNECRAELGFAGRPDGDSIAPPLQGQVGETEDEPKEPAADPVEPQDAPGAPDAPPPVKLAPRAA